MLHGGKGMFLKCCVSFFYHQIRGMGVMSFYLVPFYVCMGVVGVSFSLKKQTVSPVDRDPAFLLLLFLIFLAPSPLSFSFVLVFFPLLCPPQFFPFSSLSLYLSGCLSLSLSLSLYLSGLVLLVLLFALLCQLPSGFLSLSLSLSLFFSCSLSSISRSCSCSPSSCSCSFSSFFPSSSVSGGGGSRVGVCNNHFGLFANPFHWPAPPMLSRDWGTKAGTKTGKNAAPTEDKKPKRTGTGFLFENIFKTQTTSNPPRIWVQHR